MRVMVIVKATQESESGVLPSREILTEMGKFNEELVKAGVMLAGEGLHASSKGVRVRFGGGKSTVTDGPVHRDQGADRGLLALAGEVHRGGGRVDPPLALQEG